MAQAAKLSRVVVLGAGFVGSEVVKALEKYSKELKVTLIDKKSYFENNLGGVRVIVQPDFLGKTTIQHRDWLAPGTDLVVGDVIDVQEHLVQVKTATGAVQNVEFDYLVIATGTRYDAVKSTSATIEERKKYVREYADKVKKAQSILIVGGGPVGVELMGEFLYVYPNKKVTLVHRAPRVLQQTPNAKSQNILMKFVAQYPNARVLVGDSVELDEKDTVDVTQQAVQMRQYRTAHGVTLEADLVVKAVGNKPNSEMLRHNLRDILDEHGYVKVLPNLQVEGHPHLFAVGDITNRDKFIKLAANYHGQETVIANNIRAVIRDKPLKGKYSGDKYKWPGITLFGPHRAISVLPMFGSVTADWTMLANMKEKFVVKLPAPAVKAK